MRARHQKREPSQADLPDLNYEGVPVDERR
jgi:hypothetical protein